MSNVSIPSSSVSHAWIFCYVDVGLKLASAIASIARKYWATNGIIRKMLRPIELDFSALLRQEAR
ncbi:MAG: hypothetical protein P8Y67_14015 [Alphaproteobacteria bacterium]